MKAFKSYKIPLVLILILIFTLTMGCDKSASPSGTSESATGSTTENSSGSSGENTTEDGSKDDSETFYAAYKLVDNQKMYGFIDATGNFVIEPSYSYVSDFSEGLATVYDNTVYRVIDTTGRTIFENAGFIEPFVNGVAIYTDNENYKRGFVDTSGKIIGESNYNTIENFKSDGTALVSQSEGVFEVIDKTGTVVETYEIDTAYGIFYDTKDGYAVYNDQSSGLYKMGVISIADKKIVIKPMYNEILNLGEGYFAVKDPSRENYDTFLIPAALFDATGKQLSDYVYYDISPFHNGLASATDEHTTFFIDTTGKKVETLPIVEGRGTLLVMGEASKDAVIKADIDSNLYYIDGGGNILWKGDNTRALTDAIAITENIYKPSRLICIKYPEVQGLEDASIQSKINETLYDYFANARDEAYLSNLSVDDSFSARLIGNLLIVEKNGYDYPAGAAHGMPVQEYYHIDLKTGAFYTFKDLFKANSDFSETLTNMLKELIQKRIDDGDYFLYPDSFTTLPEEVNFAIDEAHLTIYFYPYDIAPYAAGFQYFEIPYADMMSIIDTEGDLWKSFNN